MNRSCVLLTHLHSNDRVDEEEHDNEQCNVRQSLERLDEGPQKRSNAFASAQKFHQSHDTEESEKVYRNYTG